MNALRRLIIAAAVLAATTAFARDVRADVLELKIDDQISPASAEVITSAIERAERQGASALIITLNTPGGLDTSMREIISAHGQLASANHHLRRSQRCAGGFGRFCDTYCR